MIRAGAGFTLSSRPDHPKSPVTVTGCYVEFWPKFVDFGLRRTTLEWGGFAPAESREGPASYLCWAKPKPQNCGTAVREIKETEKNDGITTDA